MILRARTLLPLSQPPLDNGAVAVRGDRLERVGPWSEFSPSPGEAVWDLGERVLLPGLINAHCHLDYTDLGGQILPARSFTDWIKAITAAKGTWSDAEFVQSWRRGAAMLLRSGVTTVANVEAMPEGLSTARADVPLRLCSFLELIHLRSDRDPAEVVRQALHRFRPAPSPRFRPGLSPHAPYSTTPTLLQYSAQFARQHGWRLTVHVAESRDEYDMFTQATGPLFNWLKAQRAMTDCGYGSPIQLLEQWGVLGPDLLAVHVNYLGDGDAERLARHRVAVVHCPRSHAFFQHQPFPYESLSRAGVPLCLGTDSLATVAVPSGQPCALDLFAEMRAFARQHPQVPPAALLRLATTQAAHGLGLDGLAGALVPGAWADLIALPYAGSLPDVEAAIVAHRGPVAASMIGGAWAVSPEPPSCSPPSHDPQLPR